ncbi:MAG: TonB-dependent receptor plug domain-containing protein, partial [Rhodanobacteraceae bacterium]
MTRHLLKLSPFALALIAPFASAQDQPPADDGQQTVQPLPGVTVYGQREDTPAKLEHQMPEVAGTQITVTKKTAVTKLDHQPTIIDNNMQQLFVRSPGIFVSEQSTPTQFNLSYRGLGNPQESEYVLVMQDGIPVEGD